jgi:glucose/arabinose dehydrogenase
LNPRQGPADPRDAHRERATPTLRRIATEDRMSFARLSARLSAHVSARPGAHPRAPVRPAFAGLVSIALAVVLSGCATPSTAQPAGPVVVRTERASVEVTTFASGLEFPWGLAFMPDGRMLVTERPGRLRIVATDGSLSAPIEGVPAVFARGQGGLLDVAVSPQFASDRTVFLAYAEPTEIGGRTAVARAVLDGTTLREQKVIFRQRPEAPGGFHFGSRLVFDREGHLFVTMGDRFSLRDQAQVLSSTLGKVVRIGADGSIPRNNPFVSRAGALPEIWSYGHRNVQGAALHPGTGRLWIQTRGIGPLLRWVNPFRPMPKKG